VGRNPLDFSNEEHRPRSLNVRNFTSFLHLAMEVFGRCLRSITYVLFIILYKQCSLVEVYIWEIFNKLLKTEKTPRTANRTDALSHSASVTFTTEPNQRKFREIFLLFNDMITSKLAKRCQKKKIPPSRKTYSFT
jgi:hypothetical protein